MVIRIKDKLKDKIPITLYVDGNNINNGCVSIFVTGFTDATYSFDNGETWQQSNYGAIYENGDVNILVKNSDDEIIFQKTMTINSIINDSPNIQIDFDQTIPSFTSTELLNGVTADYNSKDITDQMAVSVIDHDNESVLVAYSVENEGKKCSLLRKIYISEETVINQEWLWPTDLPYSISSPYGWRSGKFHSGVDIYGLKRGSYIYAARDGEVVDITSNASSGYYVILKHDNGYYTRYAHMQNVNGNDRLNSVGAATKYIQIGQRVKAHDIIGEFGG